ncbi:hypothetical protein Sru01_44470 [Sphaerisporangium rufum]|uniref:Uncharacterized protein n=1 Tax=Sphaerisporangium rufum TaxID=1381558 RepID=A0A919R732_9ACTN|nr:hypothetical protein [Sphaerisporangium rufum]GII79465.1 hypothetical protein Sru01_44470 [Sphaerisporangium rufum]
MEYTVKVRRGVDAEAWGMRIGIRRFTGGDGPRAVLLGVRAAGAAEPEAFLLGPGESAEAGGRVLVVREIAAEHVLVASEGEPWPGAGTEPPA